MEDKEKQNKVNEYFANILIGNCKKIVKQADEEIEEMAKEIFNTCAWRFGKPNDYKEVFNDIAEDLTKLGYRKLPEDSVVLTLEDLKEIGNFENGEWTSTKTIRKFVEAGEQLALKELEQQNKVVLTEREFLDNCELNYNKGYKQGSKEAVEKFARDLLSVWGDLEKWSEKYYEPHSGITPVHIKKYAKQIGIEIKE